MCLNAFCTSKRKTKLLLILSTMVFAAFASSSRGRHAPGWGGTGREVTLHIISGTVSLLITRWEKISEKRGWAKSMQGAPAWQ